MNVNCVVKFFIDVGDIVQYEYDMFEILVVNNYVFECVLIGSKYFLGFI